MTLPVLRSDDGWWLRTTDGVVRIDTAATTTAELLADRDSVLRARDTASATPMPMLMAEVELSVRSPVTVPCRVLAQMTNFASHVADAGMDPATVPLTFFRKSSGSISDPEADIVRLTGPGPTCRSARPVIAGSFSSRTRRLLGTLPRSGTSSR